MSSKGKVTIYDISKKLNVSGATVSRALNNHPDIKQKTKDLIVKTAVQMNYKQNRLAQALKSGKTNTVGIIVPFINRSFFSSVIRGIEEELNSHGFHIIICQSHDNVNNEIKHLQALLSSQVDGIFISVSKTTKNKDHLNNVLKGNTPLVFFDRQLKLSGVSSVTIDDFRAGFIATKHLAEIGCKRIAYFSGDMHLDIYRDRYRGYISALKEHGLSHYPEYTIHIDNHIESGKKAVKTLWSFKEKPDAIFSSGDYSALGAIQELKNKCIKIPEEISIVGFSNEPFTEYMELSLTTIDQTPLLMGRISAKVFLEQIKNDQQFKIEKKIVLSPTLIVRNSSTIFKS